MTNKKNNSLAQETQGEGNTKTSPLNEGKHRKLTFTWNNYHASSIQDIINFVEERKGKYGIGEEVGSKTQTSHLQGWVSFPNQIQFSSLKSIDKSIHWEKMKGTIQQNHEYCSKEGKYITNDKSLPEPLDPITLWADWQFDLEKIVQQKPDYRKIYWYWDTEGNIGKTTLARYLHRKYGAIPIEGCKKDILNVAMERPSKIYIMDLERDLEGYVSYASIEKIKNGFYMSGKYEGGVVDRNPPHVIIFANFPPNERKISKDKWIIKCLDK